MSRSSEVRVAKHWSSAGPLSLPVGGLPGPRRHAQDVRNMTFFFILRECDPHKAGACRAVLRGNSPPPSPFRPRRRERPKQTSSRKFVYMITTEMPNTAKHRSSPLDTHLSSGEVTRTAMRHCLVLAGVRLTSLELSAVDQSFRSTTRPEMIGWKAICRAAVEVCDGGGLGRSSGSGRAA